MTKCVPTAVLKMVHQTIAIFICAQYNNDTKVMIGEIRWSAKKQPYFVYMRY